jgi:hypothetical protein
MLDEIGSSAEPPGRAKGKTGTTKPFKRTKKAEQRAEMREQILDAVKDRMPKFMAAGFMEICKAGPAKP